MRNAGLTLDTLAALSSGLCRGKEARYTSDGYQELTQLVESRTILLRSVSYASSSKGKCTAKNNVRREGRLLAQLKQITQIGRVAEATKKDARQWTRALPVSRRSAFNAALLCRRCPRMGLSSNGCFRSSKMTIQASEGGGDLRSVAAKEQRHSLPISNGYHQQPYRRKSRCR